MRNYTIRRKAKTKKHTSKGALFLFQLLFIFAILFSYNAASAQEIEKTFDAPAHSLINDTESLPVSDYKEIRVVPVETTADFAVVFEHNIRSKNAKTQLPSGKFKNEFILPNLNVRKKESAASDKENAIPDQEDSSTLGKDKFHWKPALLQSGLFLGIQHGFRMTQVKTRRELGGQFFRDWANSVKNLRGWNDSDNFVTNDIMHPLQGGLTGRIFVNNSDNARRQEFGKSKEYWQSRFKALVWSTVWSTQFELGPVSEATIGNVGLREKNGYSTMAYTDLVKTPILGTGVLIGEDAIDKYIFKDWLERKAGHADLKLKILRSAMTPTTSFANVLRGKMPWKRDYR